VTEKNLQQEIENVISVYERLIGNVAQCTRLMIERDGAITALSKLAVSADLQSGFKALRNEKLLDQSFEALIVKYRELFSADVVAAAKWRLDNANDLL
jgi:hypothetical protein